MGLAYDFSSGRPSPAEMRARGADGVLVYDRVSTPNDIYLASCRSSGLAVAFIHEEYGTEAEQGYWRGVTAAQWANNHVPANTVCYVNAWDGPKTPSDRLQAVREYFFGFGETWRDAEFGAYGNPEAITMAALGHPKCTKWWGVETWVPSRMNLDQSIAWHSANGYALVQIANYHTMPQTDDNRTISDDWATLHKVDPIVIPPKRKVNDKMWIAWFHDSNWCDVWYNGVLVDGFTNSEPNMFGIGPRFQRYLDMGAGWTPYATAGPEYDKIRAQLMGDPLIVGLPKGQG